MAEVTVDDLREYLGQVPTDKLNTDRLEKILARARSIANDYVSARLGPLWTGFGAYQSGDRTVVGQGRDSLVLPAHQVGTVSKVTAGGVEVVNWTEDEFGALNFNKWPLAYLNDVPRPYATWGFAWYVVTAAWGFGPTPDSVNEVYLELAVNIWRGKDRGMWTETVGESGTGVRFTGGLTSQQRGVLDAVVARFRGPQMSVEVQTPWGS